VGVLLTHHQPQGPGNLRCPSILLGRNSGNRGLQTTQQQIQQLSGPAALNAVSQTARCAGVHYYIQHNSKSQPSRRVCWET
jgi:hypothetical protein